MAEKDSTVVSRAGGAPPPPPEPVDWDEAERLYREKGLDYTEIAAVFDRHPTTIAKGLQRRGVPRARSPRHRGEVGRKLYGIWAHVRSNCKNPRARSYAAYGARGVKVCRDWQTFAPFYEWAVSSGFEPGKSLELVRKGSSFAPGNCRWVESRELARCRGRRARPRTRTAIHAFGETKSLSEWARDPRCTIGVRALRARLRSGLPPERAIALPRNATRGAARGRAWSRPTTKPVDMRAAARLYEREGLAYNEIARRLGVQPNTIASRLRRMGVAKRAPRPREERLLYRRWQGIHERCSNEKSPGYRYYGGKGIQVCAEWCSYETFRAWALESGWRTGLSLARIDHAGPYAPRNCRWIEHGDATRGAWHEDARKRPRWLVTAFGETKGPTAWSRDPRCVPSITTLIARLRDGMSPERALTLPLEQEGRVRPRTSLAAFGETKSYTEWIRDPRCVLVSIAGLRHRLEQGMAPEEALTVPAYRRGIERARRRSGGSSGTGASRRS